MRAKIVETKSAEETAHLGRRLAFSLIGKQSQQGVVLGLVGDLGSGKTTFVQGLAAGLGVKSRIVSPTFILMRRYKLPNLKSFFHVDLYRLNTPEAAATLGLSEIWSDPKNILVVEWAEKIRPLLPPWTDWIVFSYCREGTRKISSDLLVPKTLK